MTWSETFEPSEASVRAARDFVQELLSRTDHDDEDALLVISELATNVVRHARTEYTVSIQEEGDGVELSVSDGSSILPAVKDLSERNKGYGLIVVDRISEEWGVEPTAKGKRVWARLNTSQPTA